MKNRFLLSELLTELPACTHGTLIAVVRDAVSRQELKAVPFGVMPGGQGPELVIQGTEDAKAWVKALQEGLKGMLRADWSKKGLSAAPFDPEFVTDELLDAMLAASEKPASSAPSGGPKKKGPNDKASSGTPRDQALPPVTEPPHGQTSAAPAIQPHESPAA